MKKKIIYACTMCGAEYPKWLGRCEDCGSWNSIEEENLLETPKKPNSEKIDFFNIDNYKDDAVRIPTNISEFDYACGDGLVIGSVVLIGGEPGVGKSTLLLQIAAKLSQNHKAIYISGEESVAQICIRAKRLNLENSNMKLACETDLQKIIESLDGSENFLIIDSIQTLKFTQNESIPGTVQQIKTCAYALVNYAKQNNTTVILVGHITKDGAIAGPKLLEHIVDTVLYFEGDNNQNYRILRSAKNRYGPSGEVGVFEMSSTGLVCISNPSCLFISENKQSTYGNVIYAAIEGSRPILAEVQVLTSKSFFPSPRRNVVGCDLNRLHMIIAVLESRCGVIFTDQDVYVSIAGGLKINEPACDIALAISLISSRRKKIVDKNICVFGEIGLTGEIRPVNRMLDRIKEAFKLGFKYIICPQIKDFKQPSDLEGKVYQVQNLSELIETLERV